MEKILDHLRQLSFFESLNDQQMLKLSKISSLHKYAQNYTLYYEGDNKNRLLFLVQGSIKTYKVDKYGHEILLGYIYKDTMISEISSFNNHLVCCYSNAECMQESIIVDVDYQMFKEYFIHTNILTDKFIDEILLQTQQLRYIINRELVFDATAKVAYMLHNNLELFNKLKRQEASFMLHIQPETLSRVLKKLKRQNLIDFNNQNIIINNQDALQNIFNGGLS